MKKIAFLVACISLALCALAQTQQGYVRTIGKPGKKGVALSGVTVRAKGNHNAVVSKSNGRFSMKMKGLKNGDAYSLQQVQKNGYELNDAGTIGRQYAFSATVPLTIVMVSTAQLQAEKQRIENNAYAVAEKNYKAKMAKLEKQLNENTITAEEYRAALQELQDSFEKYQSLIESLADHYAHTDYDMLDENEAEINTLIENGELEKTDSLIHTLFDPIDVLKRNKEALDRLDQTITDAQGIIDQANEDYAAVLKQQEKDAEYLYQLYTIALAQFDNERAAKYIQTRAELDTTNVQWQNDAGRFVADYLAKYQLALSYHQRSLNQAFIQFGNQNNIIAAIYIDIANIYMGTSQYDKALEFQYKSLNIRRNIIGENHEDTGQSYNAIGLTYHEMSNFDSAYVYYMKSLDINNYIKTNNYHNLSVLYGNIGRLYFDLGDFDRAIEYLRKAVSISETYLGKESIETAICYNTLALVYFETGQEDSALDFFKQSYYIREKIFGVNHPRIATMLINIGSYYLNKGNDDEALPFFMKALEIRKNICGEMNPQTAVVYRNLGSIYNHKEEYNKALDYHLKALTIFENELGTNLETIVSYNAIGLVYRNIENYDEAIKYYKKGLNMIVEITGNPEHKYIVPFYQNIGDAYYNNGDYTNALEYCKKAQKLNDTINGNNSPTNARICNTIGLIYYHQDLLDQAIENYTYALSICKDEHLKALLYLNMGKAYEKKGEYKKAMEYYEISLNLSGPDHPDTNSIKESISSLQSQLNQ